VRPAAAAGSEGEARIREGQRTGNAEMVAEGERIHADGQEQMRRAKTMPSE
jgi:hypothetical protein